MISPKLPRYGVTRVSDVTGLDTLGVPVAMATRPLSWTLSVSQGKGQTLMLAKVSAAMEAVELWHAEHAVPEVAASRVSATGLGLRYSTADLAVVKGRFLTDQTPLDWVAATGMCSGAEVLVPVGAVFFPDPSSQGWDPAFLQTNSNGLASGNILQEAAVHALYEIIERHVLCGVNDADMSWLPAVDPQTVPDPVCRDLVAAIREAGGSLLIQALPNDLGVPTFRALLWSWEFSIPCGGYGSHSDPLVAVSRAVTEAAQSRLAAIVGSRDDMGNIYGYLGRRRSRGEQAVLAPPRTAAFESVVMEQIEFSDLTGELSWLTDLVHRSLGHEPLLLDLSTDPDFAVVKIVVPGAAFEGGRVHYKVDRAV